MKAEREVMQQFRHVAERAKIDRRLASKPTANGSQAAAGFFRNLDLRNPLRMRRSTDRQCRTCHCRDFESRSSVVTRRRCGVMVPNLHAPTPEFRSVPHRQPSANRCQERAARPTTPVQSRRALEARGPAFGQRGISRLWSVWTAALGRYGPARRAGSVSSSCAPETPEAPARPCCLWSRRTSRMVYPERDSMSNGIVRGRLAV